MKLALNDDVMILVRRLDDLPNGIPAKVVRVTGSSIILAQKSTSEMMLFSKQKGVMTEYDDHIDFFVEEEGVIYHIFSDLEKYDNYTKTAVGGFEAYAYKRYNHKEGDPVLNNPKFI